MRYALLLYGDERAWQDATAQERREVYAAHGAFLEMLEQRGAVAGGAELGEALEYARAPPSGVVEVRPCVEPEGAPDRGPRDPRAPPAPARRPAARAARG